MMFIQHSVSLRRSLSSTVPKKINMMSKGKWLILIAIIVFIVLVRIRLLDVPLERDEGEYAYMGQLLIEGISPYKAAYNMKFPGVYLMYGLIMSIAGQSVQGIHLGLLIINCISVLLVFYLCVRTLNDSAALIASGIYAVLSLSPGVYGFAAHATQFVVLPAIAGAILLFDGVERKNTRLLLFSGLLTGLALIMKQQAFFFTVFGVVYILYSYYSAATGMRRGALLRGIISFLSGVVLPLFVVVVWLYMAGVLGNFWFWTIQYASKYVTQVPGWQIPWRFADRLVWVTEGVRALWIMSAGGLIVALIARNVRYRGFIILFFLSSFLTVCPGFYFTGHYFVTLLPAVAMLAGLFMDFTGSKASLISDRPLMKYVVICVFIIFVMAELYKQRDYLFFEKPEVISRKTYGLNPFLEAPQIAKFIENRSTSADTIAVFGSEPEIYFYSKRRSATGYIYTYSLMENHEYALKMQKQMKDEIESSSPKFIIYAKTLASWLKQQNSECYIFEWFHDYVGRNYRIVGITDMSKSGTVYKWGEDAEKNVAKPEHMYILIYEKKIAGES